jgi:hypothetical protein
MSLCNEHDYQKECTIQGCIMCQLHSQLSAAQSRIKELEDKLNRGIKGFDEIEQELGKALGYPWYKDDQKNFPGTTEANGVCVGDHVAESIAAEAAHRITTLEQQLEASKLRWQTGKPTQFGRYICEGNYFSMITGKPYRSLVEWFEGEWVNPFYSRFAGPIPEPEAS